LKLKVGFVNGKPSSYFDEFGQPTGIYLDVIKYIAEQENWDIEFVVEPWNILMEQLSEGSIDILLNMAVTREREKEYMFNEEAIYISWAEIITLYDSDIQSIPDLEGKRIATLRNAYYTDSDKGIISINELFHLNSDIKLFETTHEELKALQDFSVDAIVLSRLRATITVNEFDVKRSGIVFAPIQIRFGIYKDHRDARLIAEAIDRNIKIMKEDPQSEYYKSFDKHLGMSSTVFVSIPEWLNVSIYIGIIILIAVFVNGRYMKIQVNKRTKDLIAVNKELHQSEEQYRDLVEKSNIAISIRDLDGNRIYSNKNHASIFGYSAEDMRSKKINDLVHPDDLAMVTTNHKKHISGKNIPKYEFRGLKKDSSFVWLEVDGVPVVKDEAIIGVRSYFWDVTERKIADEALNNERDFNASIINSSPTFFVAVNKNDALKMINKSMLDALEYHKEEVIGKDYMTTFVPEEERSELSFVFNKLLKEETNLHNINKILSKNGKELLVEWYGKSIFNKNNEFEFFFGIGLDITEKNRLQEQLYQA
jgi:PAS domain S-box-containing protein